MDFKTIIDIIFKNKNRYNELSNKDKDNLFFIFNRYMAKKYPKQSEFFNKKSVDKATAMDIWFTFLQKEKNVPFWFWRGSTKKKDPSVKDWKIFLDFYKDEINIKDMYLLCELFEDQVKNEIKRIKTLNK